MIKGVLLLHRRADLSIDEFRRHWHQMLMVAEQEVPLAAPATA